MHPASLIKLICEKSKKHTTPPLKWGIENEKIAVQEYKKQYMHETFDVIDCGLVVSPKWPWLGCSPDGNVTEKKQPVGCIEIKCPHSKKNMTFKEAAEQDKAFYLKVIDGELKLKTNHLYYWQCQGVMNIVGLPWIDFIVITTKNFFVERIYRDAALWEHKVLPTLTNFYCTFIFPEL